MPIHPLNFIADFDHSVCEGVESTLQIANTEDAESVPLSGVQAIGLHFPRSTDGRAYSQAVVLRRRGFAGALVATGDVTPDQALQLARCGFSHARLRAGESVATAQRQLHWFADLPRYYQSDATGAAWPPGASPFAPLLPTP